jgi:hypothetical protein
LVVAEKRVGTFKSILFNINGAVFSVDFLKNVVLHVV